MYAIFSLEKVWQSHDFMHIFTHRRNFYNGLRCGLHFIIKVTAKVWTLWGQNCCNDMDLNVDYLNVDVDLPKNMCVCSKYIVHQIFPETSFQSDSCFFLSLSFLDSSQQWADLHAVDCNCKTEDRCTRFFETNGFFHPTSRETDQPQDGPGFIRYSLIGPLCSLSFLKFCLHLGALTTQ